MLGTNVNGLTAIAYISTASRAHSESEIETLLVGARTFNSEVGVTGALLLHERTFFQYFEGPAQGVTQVYERVQKSNAHKDIIELFNQPTDERVFSTWLMGFAEAPRSIVLQLEQAQWRKIVGTKEDSHNRSPGLGLLLEFCSNVRGGLLGQER